MVDNERAGTVHELTDIEVDEVSLVDRPATGRRFVLFKRGGAARRVRRSTDGETENIRSEEPGGHALAELRKRADDLNEEVDRLRAAAARMEQRLEAIEAARPARQSEDAAPRRESLWSGVL